MRWDVLSMSAAGRREDLWTGESGDSWLDIGYIHLPSTDSFAVLTCAIVAAVCGAARGNDNK